MKTEIDLDAAAEAGIIGEDQAIKLRNFQAEREGVSIASSEKFQLFGGYADLVIGMGSAMVLLAIWLFGAVLMPLMSTGIKPLLMGLLFLTVPIGIFQVSKRIDMRTSPATAFVLTIAFCYFCGFGIFALITTGINAFNIDIFKSEFLAIGLVGVMHIGFITIHWRCFRFPPTIALMAASYSLLSIAVLENSRYVDSSGTEIAAMVALLLAIGTMIAGVWWDLTDIRRETERSQVAFWLHCCAGFLMTRALFSLLTGQKFVDGDIVFTGLSLSDAPYVILMVLAAAFISLLLDRRSLLVGCLLPMVTIFGGPRSGTEEVIVGLTIAGGALILFSILWSYLRTHLLSALPSKLAAQLPRTNLVQEGQRPTRKHQPLWHLESGK